MAAVANADWRLLPCMERSSALASAAWVRAGSSRHSSPNSTQHYVGERDLDEHPLQAGGGSGLDRAAVQQDFDGTDLCGTPTPQGHPEAGRMPIDSTNTPSPPADVYSRGPSRASVRVVIQPTFAKLPARMIARGLQAPVLEPLTRVNFSFAPVSFNLYTPGDVQAPWPGVPRKVISDPLTEYFP